MDGTKKICIILLCLFLFFFLVPTASASWWDSGWQYKTTSPFSDVPVTSCHYSINVSSASGTNNATHVFTNGHNASNFDCSRFILDDTTELSYWIEDNTTDPIKVWVNVTDNGTVSMYYGNPTATSKTNGEATFPFFDDGEAYSDGDDVTLGGWTYMPEAGGGGTENYQYDDAKAVTGSISITGDGFDNFGIYHNFSAFSDGSGILEFDMYDNGIYGFGTVNTVNTRNDGIGYYNSTSTTNYVDLAGGYTILNDVPGRSNGWHQFIVLVNSSGGTELWVDGDKSAHANADGTCDIFNATGLADYSNSNTWWDRVRVRSYLYPTWTAWTAEEQQMSLEFDTQRKLARTSDGYLYRVYNSSGTVYAQKSIDNGANWQTSTALGTGSYPTVLSNSEDYVYVFYQTGTGIAYRVFNGVMWAVEAAITSDGGETPMAALDSNDNVLLLYMVDVGGTYQINETVYTSSWSAPSNVTDGTNDCKYPTVAFDTIDYAHAAYQEWNSTASTYNIRYKKKTSSWQATYNITDGETYNQTNACIALSLDNHVHIAWQTEDFKIQYKEYTTSWQASYEVVDGAPYEQLTPSVSAYSDNDVSVQWVGKTATYDDNWIVREKHNTGAWSGITEVLHPAGKNATNPSSISAIWPMQCEDCYINLPLTGYAFVYLEDSTVKHYNASTWRCSDVYTLTILALDSGNEAITNFTATLSNGDSQTVTDGTATFTCLEYGYYTVTVSSNGYYPSTSSIVMDQNKEDIVFLSLIADDESYPPVWRDVTFVVQTVFGTKYADVYVTATPINTTLGGFDWLKKFFGFDVDYYGEIENTTLSGYTDSEGKIVFVMKEEIRYRMNFTKAADDIDTTIEIYPDDDLFIVYVNSDSPYYRPTVWYDDVNFTITWTEINNTHAYINFSYNDTLNETMPLTFYINDTDANETNVYNFTYAGDCNVSINSTIVDKTGGKSFYLGFYSTHSTYGSLHKEYTLKFKYFQDVGLPKNAALLVGMCFIVLFASFFTVSTAHIGAIFVCLMGWILYYWNWLLLRNSDALTILALGLISSIAIMSYIAERGRRTNLR